MIFTLFSRSQHHFERSDLDQNSVSAHYVLKRLIDTGQKPKKCKESGSFFFLRRILRTRRVDSTVKMWIQIRAR